jgi:low affinity Fe/Cu permease
MTYESSDEHMVQHRDTVRIEVKLDRLIDDIREHQKIVSTTLALQASVNNDLTTRMERLEKRNLKEPITLVMLPFSLIAFAMAVLNYLN